MCIKYWMEKQFNNTTYNINFICYICVYAHICRKAWKCLNSLFILNFPLYFFSALSPINRYIFYIRNPKSMTDNAHPCQSLSVLTVPSCSPSQLGMAQLVHMSEASISWVSRIWKQFVQCSWRWIETPGNELPFDLTGLLPSFWFSP